MMLGSAVSAGGSAIGPSTSSAYSTWYDEAIFVPRNIRAARVLPPKTLPEEFEQRQINRVTFWKSEPTTTTIKPQQVSRSRLVGRTSLRSEVTRIPSISNSTLKTDLPESFPLQEIDEPSVHSPELAATCATYAQTISSTNSYGAFRMPDGKLSNHTTRRGALFCRSGNWLEILDEKESRRRHRHTKSAELVRGNTHARSEFSILHFISVAFGLVSIRGEKSDRFLCMDEHSRLYAAHPTNYSAECVFLEEMLENYYNLYSSCAHFPDPNDKTFKPWYVAIRKDGRPRRGRHSRKRRRSSHFLVIHFDVADPLPVNVDVTRWASRVVSSSIRHSSRGNEIDERKWFSPAVPPPPTVPTNLQTDYLSQFKDEKPKKKKRRKEERLRKEKEEREKRVKEIEEKRFGEVEKQREQREEVERKRMAQKKQQWGGGGGYSRFRANDRQAPRRTPQPPSNSLQQLGRTNSQSKTYFTYSSG